MNIKQSIILIGYMGAGKSTVGKKLAQKCGVEFFDMDEKIEQKEHRSIVDIFALDGEAYFRAQETELLRELLNEKKIAVISTGGGVPLREENRALMKAIGLVVFLQVSEQEIIKRLKEDNTRPLLESEDREKKIRIMLEEREPLYQKAADIPIKTDGKKLEEIVREILQQFK